MVDKYKLISYTLFTVMWIQFCWGFVCTDLFLALEPSRNYIYFLIDLIYVFLGLITIRSRRDVVVFVSFVVIAFLSAYINHQGLLASLNGFRSYIGLLFVPPILRYLLKSSDSDRFVESMDRQLYIFLWIQVPCLVSQFIRFGACDAGGGSIGYGASGLISTLIYVISFYLINKKWNEDESYFHNLWENRVLVFLLFPTFLNETKISLIFFLLYFFLLIKIDRKFILRSLVSIPIGLCLFAGMGYVYVSVTGQDQDRFNSDFFYDYLIGLDIEDYIELSQLVQDEVIETDNLWVTDIPRFGRFVALPDALDHTGGGFLLGAGIGQFKGGSVMGRTKFASEYKWLLDGSVIMLFFIIIELGIAGLVWLTFTLVSLVLTPDNHLRHNNILFFLLAVMAMIFVYHDQYRYIYYCLPVFYIYMCGLQSRWQSDEEEVTDD